ncbi:MAG: DegV family protein [Clostridia bacterium]|nr:DegV family protein [Clostridia bacterium]
MAFEILTDSSANLSREMVNKINVKVLPLTILVGEEEIKSYKEDAEFDYVSFYGSLREGEHVKTSLINADTFISEFEKFLNDGKDVLAIIMSSGISGTYQSAKIAADTVREKYPDRQVIVIDSLSASIGQGLLVYYAAKLRDEGKTIEETADWVYKNRLKMVHKFTVDDLFFLKRGGRLSGGVAIVGTILQIKPVLHVDNEGHLVVQNKVNGRKKSINALFNAFKEGVVDAKNQVVAICHADCLEDAEYLAEKIKKEMEVIDVIIDFCDPVLGAHAGPGTLALFYLAEER